MNQVQVLSRSGVRWGRCLSGLALACALAILLYGNEPATPDPSSSPVVNPSASPHPPDKGSGDHPEAELSYAERLTAQALINIDGRPWDPAQLFDLDARGQLVLDERLLDRLASLHVRLANPEQASVTMAALQAAFQQGLPPAQAGEAMRLVRAYQAYEDAEQAHMQSSAVPTSMDDVQADQRRRAELQARFFGPGPAQALFAQRNAQALIVAEAALLADDTTIPLAQRQAQIAALRLRLPPALRAAIVDPD